MTCGIYKLIFNGTDRVYIGQSVDIEKRFKAHLSSFKKKIASAKLTEAYSLYGNPYLVIIHICDKKELDEAENRAIEEFKAYTEGFNTLQYSQDLPVRPNNDSRLVHFTKEQVLLAFNTLIRDNTFSSKQISLISGISEGMVFAMREGSNYTWLYEIDPSNYTKYILNRPHGNSALAKGIVYLPVVSPSGEVHHITNRSAFAKLHNLDCGALGRVLRKVAKSHKGWKLA